MDSGLDLVGTAGAFFRGKSETAEIADFAVFRGSLLTGALGLLGLTDMACFPGFSTLPLLAAGFAAALTGGLPAGLTAALGAVLALGLAAALGCALCGFLDVLGFVGLAVGMEPPVVGNCFKYLSATSKQKCALAPAQNTGTVTRIQGQEREGGKTGRAMPGHIAVYFSGQAVWANIWCAVLAEFPGESGRLIC
ncbi:hypothetical protein [Polaromonas sp. YR568]|uniref:hypothetical protein n=1 Tax=Polaromonas sp. YR568 TaxID=1855301 RepID=UPI00398BBD26